MRTHGWAGQLPLDELEARQRLLAAARQCLEQDGVSGAGIADVARAVGVTRQTVYRYYATTEELLNAAALETVAGLFDQVTAHVAAHLGTRGRQGSPADAAVEVVVEVLAYVAEHLREDHALNRLLTPGRLSSAVRELTSPSSIALGQSLLNRFPVDWDALSVDRAELVEHLLRVLQSLVLDPGTPPRDGAALRGYLHRWVGPALHGAP